MKRVGNLYEKIISIENLEAADLIARKGKKRQYGVIRHDKNRNDNINVLHAMLRDKTYRTSEYDLFTIFEPKKREISRLPYYPDRIAQHAIMRIIEPVFTSVFTSNTFSCIKGRGIHGAFKAVKNALRDEMGTKYCLKLDIKKFYPSIDHRILKRLLRRKFKDDSLLWLLDEIIDSSPGVPIGNYVSQFFANYYLSGFDHWLKEVKKVKYYFRYADDLVFFAPDKESLHQLLADIREYLQVNLKLEVKKNYQVFPVASRGLDFIGYRFFHTHVLLRKTIKKKFARLVARKPKMASIAAYYGWACHCNSNHLLKKLLTNEKITRLGHNFILQKFYRQKHSDRRIDKQRNIDSSFQTDRLNKKAGNQMSLHPN